MKLSKSFIKEILSIQDDYTAEDADDDAVESAKDALETAIEQLKELAESIPELLQALKDAVSSRSEIASDVIESYSRITTAVEAERDRLQEAFDGKSEDWQESEAGSELQEQINSLEEALNLDSPDADECELPELDSGATFEAVAEFIDEYNSESVTGSIADECQGIKKALDSLVEMCEE